MQNPERTQELHGWLGAVTGNPECALQPVEADASVRRYFRVSISGSTRIVMDAAQDNGSCKQFAKVAGLMRQAGLNAPRILAADFERGFMLLSDLGRRAYLDELNDSNADELFSDAMSALIAWQLASKPQVLPLYDDTLLQTELDLWTDWYLARHRGVELDAAQRGVWKNCCDLLKKNAMTQVQVYVHRDFMPRNLFVCNPNPGIIDFQDAVHGAVSYDLVSLFRDAFISWDEQRVAEWTSQYHERASAFGIALPSDRAEFQRQFDWMGVHRHLKVIGIFARLNYRDNKPAYARDIPRFQRYLESVLPRYRELSGLHRLVNEVEVGGARQ